MSREASQTALTRALRGALFFMLLGWALAGAPAAAQSAAPSVASSGDSEAIRKSAKAAMQAKDWPLAQRLWSDYLASRPQDYAAYTMRALTRNQLRQPQLALADYRRSVELEPERSEAWTGLCWTQLLLQQPLDARPQCERAVALNKTSVATLINLGHTFLLSGDAPGAPRWYRAAVRNLESEEDLADGPLADFDLFIANKWQPNASREAKAWFKKEAAAWFALRAQATQLRAKAQATETQNDWPPLIAELEALIDRLVARYGADTAYLRTLLTTLAGWQQNADQAAAAMASWQRALAVEEANWGIEHSKVADSENTVAQQYRELQGLDAQTDFYTARLAQVENQLGKAHRRASALRSALIALLDEQQRFAEALPLIEASLALADDTKRAALQLKLADAYHGLGRSEEAIAIYRRSPSAACKPFGLVDIYGDLGRLGEAIDAYERCPFNELVFEKLAFLYQANGDLERAIQTYLTLLENGKNAKNGAYMKLFYWSAIADLRRRQGDEGAAVASEQNAEQYLADYTQARRRHVAERGAAPADTARDAAAPRLIANTGHSDGIVGMALSADQKQLFSAGSSDAVKLWDLASGRELHSFAGTQDGARAFALSADGRWMALAKSAGILEIWDVRGRNRVHRRQAHVDEIDTLAFSPDGATLATASAGKSIRLWNVASGKQIGSLPSEWVVKLAIAFSPDGRVLAVSGKGMVHLWDVASGRLLGSLRKRKWPPDTASALAFEPGGRWLAVGDGEAIALWEYPQRRLARTFYFYREGAKKADSLVFSRDGSTLYSGHDWRVARVWNVATARQIRLIESAVHAGQVTSVALLDDGTLLCAGDASDEVRLFDPRRGQRLRTLGGSAETISALAYSPERQLLASARWHINLWNMGSARQEKSLHANDMRINNLFFSAKGDQLASVGGKQIALWDVDRGQAAWSVTTSIDPDVYWSRIDLSPDGRTLISNDYRSVKRWEFASGKLLGSWDAPPPIALYRAFFSADGGAWAIDQKDIVRDLASWQPADARQRPAEPLRIQGLQAAIDGNTVVLRDPRSGDWKARLVSFNDGRWAVIDPDGRFDVADLEDMPHLHWVMPDDPLTPLPIEIFMRDYYEPRLLSRILNGEQFKPVRPLIDLKRVQPEVIISAIDPDAQPGYVKVSVEAAGGRRVYGNPAAPVASAVHDLRLFRNGQLVGQAEGRLAGAEEAPFRHQFRVRLPAGKAPLTFTAYAFNDDGVKSPTAQQSYTPPATVAAAQPRAYLITIGVNRHDNPAWNLRYAANDARQIGQSLASRLAGKKYAAVVNVALISDGETANLATKANVKAVLDILAGRPVDPASQLGAVAGANQLRQATPDDLVLISFSGHGYGDGGLFYLIPADTGPGSDQAISAELTAHAISSDELSAWLRDVDAADLAMIVDACHSAASVGESFKPGPMGSRGLGQLAFDKGMRILAASQADDVALESDLIKQGLLSFSLVQDGLDGKLADHQPKDQTITLAEWLSYGVSRVPSLADEVKRGQLVSSRGTVRRVVGESMKAKRAIQQPSLFDFTKGRRDVVLDTLTQ